LITASPIAMPYHRRAQGRAPCPPRNCGGRRPLLKTLLSDRPQHARACPAGPPRSHHNSLCTLQSTAAQTRGAVANLLRASPVARRNRVAAMVPPGAALLHLSAGKAWLCRWWR